MKSLVTLLILGIILHSCVSTKEKKSSKYYFENENAIQEILKVYKELYRHQPFSLGFSDRSFDHIAMDIITDTVRYALHNEQNMDRFREAIYTFKYDTVALRKMYYKMFDIKCIWLGTADFYYREKKEEIVFLSFRSVRFGNPFLDRKYYNLVLFDPLFINEETNKLIEAAGFKKVKNEIYFKIMGKFR
ncbi:MAG: hypothetical protein ACRC2O_14765 [Chitinophagaceae bacterium]